jgi:hypothetical protein
MECIFFIVFLWMPIGRFFLHSADIHQVLLHSRHRIAYSCEYDFMTPWHLLKCLFLTHCLTLSLVLGFDIRSLCLLGKCSTTWAIPSTLTPFYDSLSIFMYFFIISQLTTIWKAPTKTPW